MWLSVGTVPVRTRWRGRQARKLCAIVRIRQRFGTMLRAWVANATIDQTFGKLDLGVQKRQCNYHAIKAHVYV